MMLGKLLRRTPRDWREIGITYWYLLLAWWRLSVRRHQVHRWVFPVAGPAGTSHIPSAEDQRVIMSSSAWMNSAARYPWPWARCLQRSLALCLLLESRGFIAQLKIGVRKNGSDLEAHAWVEYCGKVLNDSQDVCQKFALMNGNQELPSMQQLSRAIRS